MFAGRATSARKAGRCDAVLDKSTSVGTTGQNNTYRCSRFRRRQRAQAAWVQVGQVQSEQAQLLQASAQSAH